MILNYYCQLLAPLNLSIALASAVLFWGNSVSAVSLKTHDYNLVTTRETNVPVDGFYMVEPHTTEDLIYNAATPGELITKEGWLSLNTPGDPNPEWIETGSAKGNFVTDFNSIEGTSNPEYIQGLFIAFNTCLNLTSSQCTSDVSLDEDIVNSNTSGQHNFIIRNSVDTANTWDVYIDGKRYVQLSKALFRNQSAKYIDAGIEISDTDNTYVSGTTIVDLWRVDPANETNKYLGWTPLLPNQVLADSYNGASVLYQYPIDNGAIVSGTNVTQSNEFIFNHQ